MPKLEKSAKPKAKKGEFGAKFSAWWNGIDYVPTIDDEAGNLDDAVNPQVAHLTETEAPPQTEEPQTEKELNLEDSLREINAALGGEEVPPTIKETESPSVLSLVEKTNPHLIEKNENQDYIAACEILWGKGRLSPTTNELDEFLISQLSDAKRNNIAVFGNDLGARVKSAANMFTKTVCYEKGRDFKKHIESEIKGIKNCKVQIYDEKPGSVPKNNTEALFMAFCGTKIKDVESHIFAAERILKPNGLGIWLDFVKMHDGYDVTRCAGNEGREFIETGEIKAIFDAAGLKINEESDHTKEFLNGYEIINSFLNDDWSDVQSKLMEWGGIKAANIALEQVLVWRARSYALKNGHLALKKYTFARA